MENHAINHPAQFPVTLADLETALNNIANPEDATRRRNFLDALSGSDDWFTRNSLAQHIGLQPGQISSEFGWLTRILRQVNGGDFTWQDYVEWNEAGHYRLPADHREVIMEYLVLQPQFSES